MGKVSGTVVLWMTIIITVAAMFWTDSRPITPEQEAARLERVVDQLSLDMQQSLRYAKDHATGYCFAVAWRGAGNGGPMMATVPCPTNPAITLSVFTAEP